jgi:hypothetical protein
MSLRTALAAAAVLAFATPVFAQTAPAADPVSEAADADWVESPIPEQFVSSIGADGKVHTKVSELYTS